MSSSDDASDVTTEGVATARASSDREARRRPGVTGRPLLIIRLSSVAGGVGVRGGTEAEAAGRAGGVLSAAIVRARAASPPRPAEIARRGFTATSICSSTRTRGRPAEADRGSAALEAVGVARGATLEAAGVARIGAAVYGDSAVGEVVSPSACKRRSARRTTAGVDSAHAGEPSTHRASLGNESCNGDDAYTSLAAARRPQRARARACHIASTGSPSSASARRC